LVLMISSYIVHAERKDVKKLVVEYEGAEE